MNAITWVIQFILFSLFGALLSFGPVGLWITGRKNNFDCRWKSYRNWKCSLSYHFPSAYNRRIWRISVLQSSFERNGERFCWSGICQPQSRWRWLWLSRRRTTWSKWGFWRLRRLWRRTAGRSQSKTRRLPGVRRSGILTFMIKINHSDL